MTTTAPPDTGTPPDTGPGRPAGRLTWRRVIFGGLLGLAGGFGLVHVIGGTMTALIAGGSATAGAVGYSVYKYPHVRRHFWGPWSGRKGEKGHSAAWRANWSRTRMFKSPKMPGNPFKGKGHRGGLGLGRRTGAGGRKGTGLRAFRPGHGRGKGLGRTGAGSRRGARNGSGRGRSRRGLGGSQTGTGRRRSMFRRTGTGTGRRGGLFRKSGKGSGTSRRHSPAFRRFPRTSGRSRTGSRPGRSHRRSMRHPFGGRRTTPRAIPPGRSRRRTPFHPRGGRRTSPRATPPGRSRRTPFHPLGGRRTSPRPAPAGRSRRRTPFHPLGGRRTSPRPAPAGRSRRRSLFHPFGGRRTSRRAPGGRTRTRSIRHPFGGRRFWRTPGRLRRAVHRRIGTPPERHRRRMAAKARRANARSRRRRLAGTYGRRVRWFAPWRIWTRGGGARASWRRMRARRGKMAPRGGARGRRFRLGWRGRIARRWRIRRGLHKGLGRTPLRLRMRHWFSRSTWRGRLGRMRRRFSPRRWLRNRPPPRPLLGGRHRTGAQSAGLHRFGRTWLGQWLLRRDRRRKARWMARQRPAPRVPVPGRPVAAPAPTGPNGAGSSGHRPAGSTRGGLMDVRGMADQIREAGDQEFVSPNNVHDVLTSMHEVIQATQGALSDIGHKVDEQPGIIKTYGDAAHEAAGSMSGAADALQQVVGPGITGEGATGPGLHAVAEEIRAMGGKEFEDSDDVHNTLIDLHQIVDGTQEAMYTLGHKIAELPGVVPEYSQAAFEAASSLQGIAETLHGVVGEGVTGQGPV